jgi:peroxiredoxin
LIGFLTGCAASKPAGSASAAPERLSFELPDLSGRTVKTADFAGRVVLIDFWATWCKPCEASFPFYADLTEKLGPEGFTVLAISVDEKDEDVTRFLERKPVPFVVLRDAEGSVARTIEGAIETMPTAVLLGRDGGVRLVHAGFVESDREKLEKEIRDALAAQPVTTSDPVATSSVTE